MEVRQAVKDYGYAVLLLSPHTQRWYQEKLELFVEFCESKSIPLEGVRALHIRQFIAEIAKRQNPHTKKTLATHTIRGYTQVVKGFLNWCSEEYEGIISANTTRHITMPKVDQDIIEVFTDDQIKALFKACDSEYNDELVHRDRAILAIFADTGIRLSEMVGLTTDHVVLTHKSGYIRVFGKGNKWRDVGLGHTARLHVHRYISRYRHPSIGEEKALFLKRDGDPIHNEGVADIVRRLGEHAGVKGVRCSPHTFRHTYAVNYLRNGGDLFKLSRSLGHAKTETTEIYLRAIKSQEVREGGVSMLDTMEKRYRR